MTFMSTGATFDAFEKELNRLVESFGKRLTELKKPGYSEAQLRDDFLNPLFRALGWDMENRAGMIQREREVDRQIDQIDQLVYELYGLTEEEIKLVNGETHERTKFDQKDHL